MSLVGSGLVGLVVIPGKARDPEGRRTVIGGEGLSTVGLSHAGVGAVRSRAVYPNHLSGCRHPPATLAGHVVEFGEWRAVVVGHTLILEDSETNAS